MPNVRPGGVCGAVPLPVCSLAAGRHRLSSAALPQVHVLVVDDDPAIRGLYDHILRDHGYSVECAGSRADALRAIGRVRGAVDILVLDIALPDADGADVAREITAQIGARPTLYVSGWTEEFWNLAQAPGRWLVMQKPIPIAKLIEAVDWLAGRRNTPPTSEPPVE